MDDRLQKFARLLETGSFTKAARVLHISQPALSTAMGKLERELGAELWQRGKHPLTPTAAGKIAYANAQKLRAQIQQLHQQLDTAAGRKPHIVIGMIDSLAEAVFVQHDVWDKLTSTAEVSLLVHNSSSLITALGQGEIAMAVIAAPPTTVGHDFQVQHLGNQPLIAVTHRDTARAVQMALGTKRLPNFLAYNQSSHTYKRIKDQFIAEGISIEPIFYSTSPEIMLQLVLAKRGTAVLPYAMVEILVANGQVVPVQLPTSSIFDRPVIALQPPDSPPMPSLVHLVAEITAILTIQDAACRAVVVK